MPTTDLHAVAVDWGMNMTTATVSYREHWTDRAPFRLEPAPPPRALPDSLSRLTARELTVLRAMATGASNAEIARDLFLSVATVKTHVARVLAKLGLRDRTQAVVFAYESRLVVPR